MELVNVDLTPFESKILLVMVSNLGYGIYNGIVIKKCNNRFMDFMTSKDIIEIVKCEESTFERAIKRFRKLEILQTKRKGNKNIYILNPFLFAKEKRIPKIQDKMRDKCIQVFNKEYGLNVILKDKEKGRNVDYRVSQMSDYDELKKNYNKQRQKINKLNNQRKNLNTKSEEIKDSLDYWKDKFQRVV